MKEQRIAEILAKIKNVKVAVYGDFCLDAYWILDPHGSEVSVETALKAQAVAGHYYSLGGASNVVANLAALQPKSIEVISVVGDDVFGRELTRQLHGLHVDTEYLIIQREDFDTVTFGKPYLEDVEQPRIDFGVFNRRTEATDAALLDGIRRALQSVHVLIVNQQVPGSITNESFIDAANALFKQFADRVILLDSRHFGHKFKHVCRKTNEIEAARLNGVTITAGDIIELDDLIKYAQNLCGQFCKPVFLTRGSKGILVVDAAGVHQIQGIQLLSRVDPVGAGDTVVSALALCLGAGVEPAQAAEFANFAAAVTVQKLFQTGTASAQEILEIGKDPDYVYQPDLAANHRKARYIRDTEIELCRESVPFGRIRHAVFDNDGTISTLRQGWEQIMAPMMIKAILADQYDTANETLYHRVAGRVLEYIDKSTGIETIVQMQALVEMVREFGLVSKDKILNKFGYKEIYNRTLMQLVGQRIAKLRSGDLDVTDYTIKGSVDFVESLHDRGIRLYLASGTDHEDVVAEAEALGYARLFDGGIYGAVGDIAKYTKKMVIQNIMTLNNLEGPELAVFGDGPVELRESRKREGLAMGIASDEVRRHGLNVEKRARLIKAGAHMIVPDFSQRQQLLEILFSHQKT